MAFSKDGRDGLKNPYDYREEKRLSPEKQAELDAAIKARREVEMRVYEKRFREQQEEDRRRGIG